MLLDPKIIGIIGPLGVIALAEGFVIYKLFSLLQDAQTHRLQESLEAQRNLTGLGQKMTDTLNSVLLALRKP